MGVDDGMEHAVVVTVARRTDIRSMAGMSRGTTFFAVCLCGSACCLLSGCLDQVLGVLVAPTSVVGDAAGQASQAAAASVSASSAAIASTTSVVSDINHVIDNSSDPQTQSRLSDLSNKLQLNNDQKTGTDSMANHAPPHQQQVHLRRPNDGMNNDRLRTSAADALKINPPGPYAASVRRLDPGPDVLAEDSSLRVKDHQSFLMNLQPVRLPH
jgi:hypothetical protein